MLHLNIIVKIIKWKNISIKFNIIRRENMKIKNMGFSDIVTNYEEYMSNNEDKNVLDLEIKF